MRRFHHIRPYTLIAALFLAAALPVLDAQTRDQLRRQDLTFVATQLPNLHVNFFFQLNPQDYNRAVQALDADIPNLTDAEFNVRLAALAAMAGDEHTIIFPSVLADAPTQKLPLTFRWLDDGLFVTNAADAYKKTLGTKLVAIGNTPIDQVMQQLGGILAHGNDQWLHYYGGAQYLVYQPILQGLHFAPEGPTTKLSFRTLAGQDFTMDVAPGSAPQTAAIGTDSGSVPLYLQNRTLNYWYTYVAPLKMLYFKYNVCAQMANLPFSTFSADLLKTLDSNPVDTLVMDFRGNTGGDSGILDPLILSLLQRAPALLANPKFVTYDVIDKGTFSSGTRNAMDLKSDQLQAAAQNPGLGLENSLVVIGEPTGGSPKGYGNVVQFQLSYTRLTGQYSTRFFDYRPLIPPGPYFAPDVAVPIRSTDYFARFDPVMAAILARSKGLPAAPQGSAIVVNGASFRVEQGLAPASFASVFGAFPSVVNGISVNGKRGTIALAGASQINFVMPDGLAAGPAKISVLADGAEVATGQATITKSGPGIFVTAGVDPSQPGAILNQDSKVNDPSHPAAPGSVLQIFATGYGPRDESNSAPVQVMIGDSPAQVLFSGPIPQYPGLWQINARVPDGVAGLVSVYVIAEGLASNGATVFVQ